MVVTVISYTVLVETVRPNEEETVQLLLFFLFLFLLDVAAILVFDEPWGSGFWMTMKTRMPQCWSEKKMAMKNSISMSMVMAMVTTVMNSVAEVTTVVWQQDDLHRS